ncbi:Probable ATP-dependent RNA helicase ddx49, partial [Geodia barretti]
PIEGLFQAYVLTPAQVKSCYFIVVLQTLLRTGPQSMIVFTHTCRSCHVYSELLQRHDIHCVSLHSLLTQAQRLSSLSKFKSGQVNVLVATDVASR